MRMTLARVSTKTPQALNGPFDKWFKSSPFHGGVTGSNPVRTTKKAIVSQFEKELMPQGVEMQMYNNCR